MELGSTCFFDNTLEGFRAFINWMYQIKESCEKDSVITGMEPTGHYLLNLAHILKEEQIKFVTVNPLHVKHSKDLDDNSPTKNDVKDAKVIAQLVKDGRYAEPTIPQGVFDELRVAKKLRDLLNVILVAKNKAIKALHHGLFASFIERLFPLNIKYRAININNRANHRLVSSGIIKLLNHPK